MLGGEEGLGKYVKSSGMGDKVTFNGKMFLIPTVIVMSTKKYDFIQNRIIR